MPKNILNGLYLCSLLDSKEERRLTLPETVFLKLLKICDTDSSLVLNGPAVPESRRK